jgi:hypothetical protein
MVREEFEDQPMQPPRRDRGQSPFQPTPGQRQTVQVMVGNGEPQPNIARTIGITEKTLGKHFKTELADGHAQVRAAIGGSVVRAALAGNMHAAKYWLSTHGGPEWRIIEGRQIGGFEGAPPIAVTGEGVVHFYLPDNGRDQPAETTDQ